MAGNRWLLLNLDLEQHNITCMSRTGQEAFPATEMQTVLRVP